MSSTNLNLKEEKQRRQLSIKVLRFLTLEEKIFGCNLSLILFPWGIIFLRTICPRHNYVGHKSSEKHFSFGKVSRGILSGGKYLWGNCSGAIIREQSFRGKLSGGQFSLGAINLRGQSSGGNFSSEAIILGGNCPGGNNLGRGGAVLQGTIFWGVITWSLILLRGNRPNTFLFDNSIRFFK